MKRKLLFITLLLFAFTTNYAQDPQTKKVKRCGTDEYIEYQKAHDPTYETRLKQFEEAIQQWMAEHPEGNDEKATIYIPVVVHVVYNTQAQNISDIRVQEQITITNDDFAGKSTHSMGVFDPNLKANTGIQFCLATKDQNGNPTTGIERRQTTVTSFAGPPLDDNVKYTAQGGLDAWAPTEYLNIWICNLAENCGYASYPPNTSATSGFVCHYEYWGHTGAVSPYNWGGTMTHEISHCFSLMHVWGPSNTNPSCADGDGCADTPPQYRDTYGTHTGLLTDQCSSSSPGIMYMNFQDYSDDIIMANFTPNQGTKMIACLNSTLACLKNSTVCSGAGITETNTINNISIYPNPSSGMVNVEFVLSNTNDVVITVSNILGDEVAKISKQNVTSVNIPINLADQSAGIYYVKIQSESQTITQKLLLFR